MTARRDRRRRAAVIGFVVGLASLAVIAALGFVGVRSLLNSSSGQTAEAGATTPVQRFPYSPTGLIGVTDDDGVLTSMAVLVVEPDGTGGTIVSIAASADAGSGTTGELHPVNAELSMGGPEAFSEGAERLTGLSFDVVELVDTSRLADLLDPLGDVTAELETSVYDASSGEEWEAGTALLAPDEAARLLAARVPDQPDWFMEPSRSAVWTAVADRVGAGIGSAEAVGEGEAVPPAGSLDVLVDRLFADSVEHRPLPFAPIDQERLAVELAPDVATAMAEFAGEDGVGVVAHDRAETQFVLASVVPSRLGAPLEAANVRIEVGLSDEVLGDAGTTRADVGIEAVEVALSAGLNVVSVLDESPQEATASTLVEVAEAAALEDSWDVFPGLFGDVEIVVAEVRIEGVDAVVHVGESWLTGEIDGDEPETGDDEAAAAPTTTEPAPTTTTTTVTVPVTEPPGPDTDEIEAALNAVVVETPIQFEPGSSVLTAGSETVIDDLAAELEGVVDVTVVVEGHTDSDGPTAVNDRLSQERAEAVVAALVEREVDADLLVAEGLGSAEPVLVEGVEDKEASRRVEFRVEPAT